MDDEITNYFIKKMVSELFETFNDDQKKAVEYIISEMVDPKQDSQLEDK